MLFKRGEGQVSEKYQALYRKWRPMTFDDVVGQNHITETLKHELASEKIGHAYLFCGTRGTGKTTTAKIFSRAVNCENPKDGEPCNVCDTCKGIIDGRIMDVYEMDAASNNGVDAIRNLREEVIYTPAGCKYKVYIIDEVHMLTIQAFNALLKTLEEPPEHALFILATTEPQKIPQTILSRCQRYDFKRIGVDDIAGRLKKVAAAEGINATEDALELIAEIGDGSMRDALSVLDRCSAFGEELRRENVSEIVGIVDERVLFNITEDVISNNVSGAIAKLDGLLNMGKDVLTFFEDYIEHLRSVLLCNECEKPERVLEKSPEAIEKYKSQAERLTATQLIYGITVLNEYHGRAKSMAIPRIAAEVALIKFCKPKYSSEVDALNARIEKLEQLVGRGAAAVQLPEIKSEAVHHDKNPDAPPWNAQSENKDIDSSQKKEEPKPATSTEINNMAWDMWPEALEAIKQSSKRLYMYLYKAEVTLNGDTVDIEVGLKSAYDSVATANGIDYLSELFSKVAGTNLRARVFMKGEHSKKEQTGSQASIMDIVNKKEQFGDIIKVKGEQ
ncbi:DNA polymerase III subunit gamma/tau [Monoglobus pectinilyticus]|uniref:DNA polymerase III subunit gamma/tau n=1 Tax=Monoglobus pectinilyticus TaxID=1981510 RepID=UPI002A7504D5|nr:DNA polymerase III subunit gamma/tau [Monoglobus pectinilyticus]MEE0734947.1 DNA polymerase III subunit gamma/tau [Monoglobus pectinilyticus]